MCRSWEKIHDTVTKYSVQRKTIILSIVVITLLKSVIILYGYQNILIDKGGKVELSDAFGWADLVKNARKGEYKTVGQFRLQGIVDTESRSLRPPIYVFYLMVLLAVSQKSIWLAILIQSFITTLVAVAAAYAVATLGASRNYVYAAFLLVFVFPMNALKTGSIDEASIMLVALLFAIGMVNNKGSHEKLCIIIAGVFVGISVLTRYTVILCVGGIVVFLLVNKRYGGAVIFLTAVMVTLSPWVIRNYLIYGKPVLSAGGARILYVSTTETFSKLYPESSIDDIEYHVMTDLYNEKGREIRFRSEVEQDEYFTALAVENMLQNPANMINVLWSKIKPFSPLSYYPKREGSIGKGIVYAFWYVGALLLLIVAYARNGIGPIQRTLPIMVAISYSIIGLVLFMSSRHLYPVIVLIMVSAIAQISYTRPSK